MRVAASWRAWVMRLIRPHAGEQEDAVAELLALHEEINREDDDDADCSDGAEEAHEEFRR